MGAIARSLVISGCVSNHNSPQDKIDSALWELFVAEVSKLIADPKYKSIILEIT